MGTMFEPDLIRDGSTRRLPIGPIVGAAAVVLGVVIVVAVVVPALLWLLGLALPLLLLWVGAELVAERHPVLGWLAVGIGGVLLLGRLPLLALLAAAGAVGWMLARRQ